MEKLIYYAGLLAPFIWLALLKALERLFSTYLHPNTSFIITAQTLFFSILTFLLLLNLVHSILNFHKQSKAVYPKDERISPPEVIFTDWLIKKLHTHFYPFSNVMHSLYTARVAAIKKRELDMITSDMKKLNFLPEAIEDVLNAFNYMGSYPTPMELYTCELSPHSPLQNKVDYLEMTNYTQLPLKSREDVIYGYPFNGFRGLTTEQYVHLKNSVKEMNSTLSYLTDTYEAAYEMRKHFLLESKELLRAFYSKLARDLIELDVNAQQDTENTQELDLAAMERRLKGYFNEQEMVGDGDV